MQFVTDCALMLGKTMVLRPPGFEEKPSLPHLVCGSFIQRLWALMGVGSWGSPVLPPSRATS